MEFDEWGPDGARAAESLGKVLAFDGTYFHFPLENDMWIFIVNGVSPTDDGFAMIRTDENDPYFREVPLSAAMTVFKEKWMVALTENDFVSFAKMVTSTKPTEFFD